MRVDAKKNQKLIAQFPFLERIISAQIEPLDDRRGTRVDDLNIKVQIADGDLLYRQADNVGLHGMDSVLFAEKGEKDFELGRSGECLFLIDHLGVIMDRVDWSIHDVNHPPRYANSALWSHQGNSRHNLIQFLVWVTVYNWHEDLRLGDTFRERFGVLRRREMHITIYKAPKDGFLELDEKSSVFENLYLTMNKIYHGIHIKDESLQRIAGRLDELCRLFQDAVFFRGMRAVLQEGQCRGASGQMDSVKVLCAEMCGYERVMLEDDVAWVSFQARSETSGLYTLGLGGTLPQIRNLVMNTILFWNCKPELRDQFQPDPNISVF